MTTKLRVRFDGSTLVPLEPVDLPVGSEMKADLTEVDSPAETAGQRLIRTLESLPQVDPETWAEFDRAIKEGKTPASDKGCFDDVFEGE